MYFILLTARLLLAAMFLISGIRCITRPPLGTRSTSLPSALQSGGIWAGIHYRSDCIAGLRLGEDVGVGISILQDLARTYTEDFSALPGIR